MLGLLGAILGVWMNIPLPWMIGPLVATAIARCCNVRLDCPKSFREAGQWVIGTNLGLYFTPPVIAVLLTYTGSIAFAILFAVALGLLCGWALHRLTGVDKTTAFFATAIGGAAEMASQAERHGAAIHRVAAAHGLRVLMVVVAVPFGMKFFDVHGLDPYVPGTRELNLPGLLVLAAATGSAALFFRRVDMPNACVLGPLAVAIVLTAFEIHLSAVPRPLVFLAQLFIGISLGTRFHPEFLLGARRYVAAVIGLTVAAILVAAGFGVLLAKISGMNGATAILATSPGGVAEMSLTAESLKLGVPIVTAFQAARMALLVVMIGPLFRVLKRVRSWQSRDD